MFGRKKKQDKVITRWTIRVTPVGEAPLNFDHNEWEFDLRHEASVTLMAKVIDCDNSGTCETATDGGFKFEVTPIA